MIGTILQRLDDLEYLAATLKTRLGSVVRTGVVKSVEADGVVVNLGDDDGAFVTHTIPTGAHAGASSDWRPMKVGQQVTLLSADGDLSNAVVIPGGYHDKNPAPSAKASEDLALVRGKVKVRSTDELVETVADKDASMRAQKDGFVLLTVREIPRLRIFDATAQSWWTINPEALLPTEPPPKAKDD